MGHMMNWIMNLMLHRRLDWRLCLGLLLFYLWLMRLCRWLLGLLLLLLLM